MRRNLTILLGGAVLAGLLLRPVSGRVFRVVGDTAGRLNAAGLPWEQAYATAMTVNGRQNDVVVYSARFSEPVVDQLKAQFEQQGAEVTLSRNADGGTVGFARWKEGEARFLVVAPDSQPNSLVFLFYPRGGAPDSPVFPVPEYPGGRVVNRVSNDGTDTHCAMLVTADPAEQVQHYYAGVLAAEGWKPVLPLRISGGMTCFHKQEKTCCILTGTRESGETAVTLLVRDKGF